jgi:hypothetical protein
MAKRKAKKMAEEKQHEDTRSVKQLLTEWRKLEEVRRSLTRHGLLNGDATPQDVINALRKAIPPHVFAATK